MRYWLLKGPPDEDTGAWLEVEALTRWRFKRSPPDWKAGDGVFLWEGGGRSRIAGLAEVARIVESAGEPETTVRTLASLRSAPLGAPELREDVIVGDAAFLQRGPRQAFVLEPEEAKRLGRLVSRRQTAGRDVLERWFGPAVHAHKATVADDVETLDGTKPVALIAVNDPALRASLVGWAQEYWESQVAILETDDGRDAWSIALEHKPALLIVSEMLPSMSGLEVALGLKNQPKLASTKLAILATTDERDQRFREEWGAHAVLRKPLRRIEVEARLGALVDVG